MGEIRWYYRIWFIVLAILVAGPFAIPLIWKSPSIGNRTKIVIIILVLALTIWLVAVSADLAMKLLKQVQSLQGL